MKSLIVTLFFISFLCASGNSIIYEDDNNEIKRHHLQQKCADFSTTITTSKCIGCSTAKRGQYPWQVELSMRNGLRLLCGGSLITSKLVLTAAHCVELGNFEQDVIVRLGQIDRSKDEPEKIIVNVSRKYIYPDYSQPFNDLAIVELEESVKMSDSIKPVCIANYSSIKIDTNEGSVVTSGWGSIKECGKGSPCEYPNILQGTKLFLLPREFCNDHVNEELENEEDLVTDAMICANDQARICSGDSGGGLIKNVEGKATIIGIISWGISKCPVGRPGIYTNVAKFSNWIEKIMSDTSTNGTTDTATTDTATTETTTTTTQITSNSTIQTTSSTTRPSNTITTDRTTISLMLFLKFFWQSL